MSIVERTSAVALAATMAAFGCVSGCSLLIETRDRQCERDEDCAAFENAVCDVAGGVCVAGESCLGADGCYACAPDKPEQFLNACTDAECIPYDNTQLKGLLQEDGSVPPVP